VTFIRYALPVDDENDVLRDEGEAYAQKLIQAGVTVTAVRYLGTIHGFVMLNALAETPAARSAIQLANTSLHNARGKSDGLLLCRGACGTSS
jgi:acetyl esterase